MEVPKIAATRLPRKLTVERPWQSIGPWLILTLTPNPGAWEYIWRSKNFCIVLEIHWHWQWYTKMWMQFCWHSQNCVSVYFEDTFGQQRNSRVQHNWHSWKIKITLRLCCVQKKLKSTASWLYIKPLTKINREYHSMIMLNWLHERQTDQKNIRENISCLGGEVAAWLKSNQTCTLSVCLSVCFSVVDCCKTTTTTEKQTDR